MENSDNHVPLEMFDDAQTYWCRIVELLGFSLKSNEVSKLGIASQQTIEFRRVVLARPEQDEFIRQHAANEKRHKSIAKTIDQLLSKLKVDELKGIRGGSLAYKQARSGYGFFNTNMLLGPRSCFNETKLVLEALRELALMPNPYVEPERKSKMRRRKNANYEGWDLLIFAGMGIFRVRGKVPTANFQRGTYNSALLRGLEKLHDALPSDVRAACSSALRSPTAELIKKSNRHRVSKAVV